MKFVHGLLLGAGAAFGLGCAVRFIYDKIIEAKIYKDYTKALEDFMNFKSDKKYIEYNKGLEEKYIGTLDDEKMLEGAIKGYVEGIGDEYAEYYTPEEMEEQLEEAYGNYVGIGIYMLVDSKNGKIIVYFRVSYGRSSGQSL